MKKGVFWDVTPCVRTEVSEEFSASFIRVTRISELGTTPFFIVLLRTNVSEECVAPIFRLESIRKQGPTWCHIQIKAAFKNRISFAVLTSL
jgi:hypothetical protein